ncbi:MAG: peptide deformylase [Bacteroidota bacterium]
MLGLWGGIQAQQDLNLFTEAEDSLIRSENGGPEDPLRVYVITQYEDSLLLRSQSRPVVADPKDSTLQLFIDRLYATVTDSASMGVGIAAPQVGLLRQIVWVQRFDKEGFPFEAYLNPTIRQYTKLGQTGPEGCLSIPDERDSVDRAYAILLAYQTRTGEYKIEMVEGFTAVIFQHEIDHLNGILYKDHLAKEIKEAEAAEIESESEEDPKENRENED